MDLIKQMNMSSVLNLLLHSGPLSRAEISRMLKISRSASSSLVEELLQQNLVTELEKGESSLGRKPILLDVNYQAGNAVGIKINVDSISAALVGLDGELKKELVLQFQASDGPEHCINQIICAVEELGKGTRFPLVGIGIGMGGRINYEKGLFIESSILPWKDVPIAERIEEKLSLPVYLENDANTFAVGENFFGMGKGYRNYLCISIGQGIGVGIIINNQLYKGAHHAAGEFGHTKSFRPNHDRVCSCGERGCLEARIGTPAILHRAKERLERSMSLQQLVALAEKGERGVIDIFREVGKELGESISNLITLFDPEIILIGGEGAVYGPYIHGEMLNAIKGNSVYRLGEEIPVEFIEYHPELWTRGVATLVLMERLGIKM